MAQPYCCHDLSRAHAEAMWFSSTVTYFHSCPYFKCMRFLRAVGISLGGHSGRLLTISSLRGHLPANLQPYYLERLLPIQPIYRAALPVIGVFSSLPFPSKGFICFAP